MKTIIHISFFIPVLFIINIMSDLFSNSSLTYFISTLYKPQKLSQLVGTHLLAHTYVRVEGKPKPRNLSEEGSTSEEWEEFLSQNQT